MRSLIVAADYPWPPVAGSRIRLACTVEALLGLGPVDLFSLVEPERRDIEAPPPGVRACCLPLEASSLRRYLSRLADWRHPMELQLHRAREARAALSGFAKDGYDLAWYFRAAAWVLCGHPSPAPAVVDLDDLEDAKIGARLAATDQAATWRQRAARALGLEDARRWRSLQHRIARRAAAVVVCSLEDKERLGVAGAAVVPNCYPVPASPVGRLKVGRPPTVLFGGSLRYPPNTDAARWLVAEVGPRLRRLVPGVRLRLAGLAPPEVRHLHRPPEVSVAGEVGDMSRELAVADLVAVPVRYGSGTRIKLLEAFAHRVPAVSTTAGAEGLGVADGVQLLLADEPDGFAEAAARLLSDMDLRRELADRAQRTYLERFTPSRAQARVRSLATAVSTARRFS
ncbi:MAG TPA: glycosyltransferase [Acidimicrobiales bacterium]|nr:glycosyltransferase [Acidimicrobiales bacterium]